MTRFVVVGAAAVFAIACAGADSELANDRADWTTVVDPVCDTIIARTSGGSDSAVMHALVQEAAVGELDAVQEEYSFGGINELESSLYGRIYVFDRHVPALLEYDPAGKFVRTIGR